MKRKLDVVYCSHARQETYQEQPDKIICRVCFTIWHRSDEMQPLIIIGYVDKGEK